MNLGVVVKLDLPLLFIPLSLLNVIVLISARVLTLFDADASTRGDY
jgi:hypothetical protein